MLSDEELRLKCIDFVSRQGQFQPGHPVETMIHAQMLFQFVKSGTLPIIGLPEAQEFTDLVVKKALDLLIEKRKDSDDSADCCNKNPVQLNFLEKLASSLAENFRGKREN